MKISSGSHSHSIVRQRSFTNKEAISMKNRFSHLAILGVAGVILGALATQAQTPTAKSTTLTGVVTDAMCGAQHNMQGETDAQCTRLCVKAGSAYALVVGDKVYTLHGDSPDLDKYA